MLFCLRLSVKHSYNEYNLRSIQRKRYSLYYIVLYLTPTVEQELTLYIRSQEGICRHDIIREEAIAAEGQPMQFTGTFCLLDTSFV